MHRHFLFQSDLPLCVDDNGCALTTRHWVLDEAHDRLSVFRQDSEFLEAYGLSATIVDWLDQHEPDWHLECEFIGPIYGVEYYVGRQGKKLLATFKPHRDYRLYLVTPVDVSVILRLL